MTETAAHTAPNRPVTFIAKNLWRINQGLARIGIVWALIGFLTFIKVWQPTFEYYGINIGGAFLFLGVAYFLTSWVVGWLNERWNFSRAEYVHQINVQNREYWQMIEDVKEIKEKLK